jgi:siroheme synthase (precorrin-2 oxidase/ferrochelatase)
LARSLSRRPALPVSLYVEGRRVLVVGASPAAAERADRLRRAGADVEEIAPADFDEERCRGALAVLAGAGDRAGDRRVAEIARAAGCLAYAQDVPEASDMAMPALARRGPLTLAVSTDGVAPALARRIREELERALAAAGAALDGLLADLERLRSSLGSADRGRLYRVASRLRLRGRFEVGPPPTGDQD